VGIVVVIEMSCLLFRDDRGPISIALIDGLVRLLLQVLVIIMGNKKGIISRTSSCTDTQVEAMERDY